MDYTSIDFGADSPSCVPFRARTNRQTRVNVLLTPVAIQPVWVICLSDKQLLLQLLLVFN